jgi:hypothetical protein
VDDQAEQESMSASPPVDSHQLILSCGESLKIAHKFLVMSPTDYDRMTTEVRQPRDMMVDKFSMNEEDESEGSESYVMRQSF